MSSPSLRHARANAMSAYPTNRDFKTDAPANGAGAADGAAGSTKLNGAHHLLNGHDWKPHEIEALHESGKAASAPRPKRILPQAIFQQIGKANVRTGRFRVHLHCVLRALADQRLAPRHEAVLIALVLAINRDSGATYAGRAYLEAMTGFDENTLNVILSDLR